MRIFSKVYCFNMSHILEKKIESGEIDHTHQPTLEDFYLREGI